MYWSIENEGEKTKHCEWCKKKKSRSTCIADRSVQLGHISKWNSLVSVKTKPNITQSHNTIISRHRGGRGKKIWPKQDRAWKKKNLLNKKNFPPTSVTRIPYKYTTTQPRERERSPLSLSLSSVCVHIVKRPWRLTWTVFWHQGRTRLWGPQ